MTTLNKKLLSIFLSLGIIFFMVVVYMFMTTEILPRYRNSTNHTVTIKNMKIIKNDFVDTALINEIDYENRKMMNFESSIGDDCSLSLVNLTDNMAYFESDRFNIKTIIPPAKIEFNDNPAIPQPVLNDKFKFVFKYNKKTVVELPLENLIKVLELKQKTDRLSVDKEIKLASSDNRLITFLMFSVE